MVFLGLLLSSLSPEQIHHTIDVGHRVGGCSGNPKVDMVALQE